MHVVVLELPLWAGGDEVACQSLSGWPAGASDVLILPAPVVDDGAPAAADDESDDADGEVGAHHADSASDAYAVLGLAGKRWTASQDDIRAAYRKLILKCHPDKRLEYAAECGEEPLGEDEATQRFRDLQAAFETLSDPKKRREFDSSDDFDGSTPKSPLAPGLDFFETYAPVFERYSRWSERRPVPQMGASDSAWVNVASFYNFWFDFRSWRVFCQEDEHDVAEADFREERRWMERENEKARVALKKVETARISKLVEDAYTQDPRVRANLEAEKQEKERSKKEAAGRSARDAAERARPGQAAAAAAEVSKLQQAEAAKENKKAKERERDQLRKVRARVKTLTGDLAEGQPKQHAAIVVAELRIAELSELADTLEAAGSDKVKIGQLVEAAALPILRAAGVPTGKPPPEQPARSTGESGSKSSSLLAQGKKEHVWTEHHLALLQKGSAKIPAGVPARWAKVAEFINDATGAELTEKIVSEQVKVMRKLATAPAHLRITPAEKAQGDAVAAAAASATKSAPAPKLAEPVKPVSAKPAATEPPAPAADDFSSWELVAPVKPVKPDLVAAKSVSADEIVAPMAAATISAPSTGEAAGEWTAEQQAALEKALKTVPKKADDRWEQVAAAVAGKDKAQCQARFKQLAALVSAKKQAV